MASLEMTWQFGTVATSRHEREQMLRAHHGTVELTDGTHPMVYEIWKKVKLRIP